MNNHHDFDEFFGIKYSDSKEFINTSPLPKDHIVGVNPLQAQIDDAQRQMKKPQAVSGKPFEQYIQRSIIKYQSDSVTVDRFHDSEYNRNICDLLIQCGKMTAWVEAKSTGTSMSFSKRLFKQLPLLAAKSKRCKKAGTRNYNMIGALIEFKRNHKPFAVWWCDIDDILWIQSWTDRKSFNIADLERCQIERPLLRSFPVEYYRPKRAQKFYLDIKGMMVR